MMKFPIHKDFDKEILAKFVFAWFLPFFTPLLFGMFKFIVEVISFIFSSDQGPLFFVSGAEKVWSEGRNLIHAISQGTYWSQVKNFYTYSLFIALAGALALIVISTLSVASNFLRGKWGLLAELVAVAIWVLPYWFYRTASVLLVIFGLLFLVLNYFIAAVDFFQSVNFFLWLFGAMVALIILSMIISPAFILFVCAFAPIYLFWRYGVSLGLMFARPKAIGKRTFENAFRGGNHLPYFWDF